MNRRRDTPLSRLPALFALFALLSLLAATTASAQTARFEITSGGFSRSYQLYTPGPSEAPRPLVLLLHGAGGDANSITDRTEGRWQAIARRENWLIAAPEALDTMWDTDGGEISSRLARRTDDGAFLGTVIDHISARHAVDETRIFATGFSRGAQASFLAACKLPGRIRAVAPVAMVMPTHLAPDCREGPPVGILMITGTSDPFVPAETGPVIVGADQRDTMLSPQDTARHWRARNSCAGAEAETTRIDAIPDDRATATRTLWPACSGTAPIINIRITPGGHSWPSSKRRSLFRTLSREIDATSTAAAFFKSFE